MRITGHKYDLVTCLGILEYLSNLEQYFMKFTKHVKVGGFMIVTTDQTLAVKSKVRKMGPQDLLDLSQLIEDNGYEIYGQNTFTDIDYNFNIENGLHSIVIQRIGRW